MVARDTDCTAVVPLCRIQYNYTIYLWYMVSQNPPSDACPAPSHWGTVRTMGLSLGRMALEVLCCDDEPETSISHLANLKIATPQVAGPSLRKGGAWIEDEPTADTESAGASPTKLSRKSLSRSSTSLTLHSGNERVHGISDEKLSLYAAFTPAAVHMHLLKHWPAAEEPEAWSAAAALLFVDISGFTNLCTLLDVATFQAHISEYFTRLIDMVTQRGGDVVRFVGDAILCAWFVQDEAALPTATQAACRCAATLMRSCGTHTIPEVHANLSVHAGIGAGQVHCFLVGTEGRKEFLLSGEPLQQAFAAESAASPGQCLCSAEAWSLVADWCMGAERADGFVILEHAEAIPRLEPSSDSFPRSRPDGIRYASPCASGDGLAIDHAGSGMDGPFSPPKHCRAWSPCMRMLESVLLAPGFLQLQRTRQTHLHEAIQASSFVRGSVERALRSFTHRDVRNEIDGCADLSTLAIAELRPVTVVFCQVAGLDAALARGRGGLGAVQACLEAALGIIIPSGGLLRQFMVDDKGVVLIWTFGLHGSAAEGPALRGLQSCFDVSDVLRSQQLTAHIGITAGIAFCGLVGATYRAEYSVLGPCVNLAARLMCMCAADDASSVLCDTAVRMQADGERASPRSPMIDAKLRASRCANNSRLHFREGPPATMKGYDEPVRVFSVAREPCTAGGKWMRQDGRPGAVSPVDRGGEQSGPGAGLFADHEVRFGVADIPVA